MHCAEILERTDSETRAEITFVRKEEIEHYKSFFRTAGLELITLGAGTRDASNLITFENKFGEKEEKFLFVADDSVNVTEFIQGRRNRSYQVAKPFNQTEPEEASVFVSGEKASQ